MRAVKILVGITIIIVALFSFIMTFVSASKEEKPVWEITRSGSTTQYTYRNVCTVWVTDGNPEIQMQAVGEWNGGKHITQNITIKKTDAGGVQKSEIWETRYASQTPSYEKTGGDIFTERCAEKISALPSSIQYAFEDTHLER